MCNCLSFLLENPTLQQTWVDWTHSLCRLCSGFHYWCQSLSSAEVELLRTVSSENLDASPRALLHRRISAVRGDGRADGFLEKCGIHVIRRRRQPVGGVNGSIEHASTDEEECAKPEDRPVNAIHSQQLKENEQNDTHLPNQSQAIEITKQKSLTNNLSQLTEIMKKDNVNINGLPYRMRIPKTVINGGDDTFSVFTQQGLKGTNQDSMIVWEDFIPSEKAIICGVFDGHGPHGHHVSRNVRDMLPSKIASCWQALQVSSLLARKPDSPEKHVASRGNLGGDPDHISLWEETFHNAYKLMDRELLADEDVDCVFSGTTAVTLVKQGSDLIIANVGDSRAVLGVQFDNSLLALQLTVDLTPNLPKEAERIRRCKGRVLALRKEPFVKRVWLPHENSPGLAMARAFGDYILKNFGVISVPEVTHRRISKNDKFVVLATDGIWDVLSNEQVVRIVDSCPVRSLAAQAVVDTAVRAWKVKYPDAKVDDCAVVCLFLDSVTESWQAVNSAW